MATTMTTSELPAALSAALGYMQRPIACPEEIRLRIQGLRIVTDEGYGAPSGGGRVSGSGHGSGRGGGFVTNWRSGGGSRPSGGESYGHGSGRDHGRDSYGHGRGGHRGGHHGGHYSGHRSAGPFTGGGGAAPTTSSYRGSYRGGHFASRGAPRFGNRARTDATVEDRMMDRIRDRMNKFCLSTYDATKAWLSELLDSGETGFLTGFITMVFDKAAEESHICTLYARLITELRAGFPHLDTELRRIFAGFLSVFEDAAVEPDAGSADYDAYVALRKRRLMRKGYASFVAEIARLGVLTAADIFGTCHHILGGLEISKRIAEKQGLTEEYADCLKKMVIGCKDLLTPEVAEVYRLNARVEEAMNRTDSPGLTNKARFALMDVAAIFETDDS